MEFYSLWPVFTLAALLICLASGRWLNALDQAPHGLTHRLDTLDGLRTFLALSVFFAHMAIRRVAVATGIVALPPSRFYALLGSFGVALFFMITGFLFWGKLIQSRGRVDWLKLYVSRFFRIVPLYWVLVVLYIAVVLYRADFSDTVALPQFLGQCVRWLAFGLWWSPPPLLGQDASMPMVGMTWTLFYEWVFYLSLPVLAIVARFKAANAVIAVTLLVFLTTGAGIPHPYRDYVSLFLAGMFCASMLKAVPNIRGDSHWRSVVATIVLCTTFLHCSTAYSVKATILLGVFFGFVATNTSLFGLLHLTGARRIGSASYSVYLLHGVVLSFFFDPSILGDFAVLSAPHYWFVALVASVCLVMIACASYVLIEKTGMALGQRLLVQAPRAKTLVCVGQ